MTEDLQLLERWREGDDDAGDQLLSRHFDSLCRFFRNKVDSGVDDLVQATLLRCVEKRDQFRQHSSFRTYLFVIARNLLYDRLRQRRRSPEALDFSQVSLRDLGTSPSMAAARNERRHALLLALQELPLEFQLVVELTYWEGLNATEVGEVLGIPSNTVRSRLSRARRSLDAHLQDLVAP